MSHPIFVMTRIAETYRPFSHLVMRFSRYPLDTLLACLADERELLRVFSSDDFRNTILFASPALYDELKMLLDGEMMSKKRQIKVRLSLLKYLARMSSRCTPFASMASCGCLTWGDHMEVVTDEFRVERFRLDMLYSCVIAQKLSHSPHVRQHLAYCANSTIYRLGNHIRYITQVTHGMGRSFQVRELKLTQPLRWVLKQAKRPISYGKLLSLFCSRFELNHEEAEPFTLNMIDLQLLVSDIDPMVTGGDMLEHLQNRVGEDNEKWFRCLSTLRQCLASFSSSCPVDDNEANHHYIRHLLDQEGVNSNPKYLVQLDLFSKHDVSRVDGLIVRQLRRGLDFLSKVTPDWRNANLEQFKQRFVMRYQDQEVPLLEALDPDVGVGYVLTQGRIANPLIAGLNLPYRKQQLQTTALTPLQQIMMNKLSRHDWSTSNCIILTDDDVKHLQPKYGDLPTTMAAMFEILGRTDGGEFLLGDLRFIGSSAANLLGRFAYGDEQINNLVHQIVEAEQESYSDKILAEIAHVPQSRTGNILSRPHLRDFELIYLSNSNLDAKRQILANDLMVSVKADRVVLRSASLNKEILPRLTTAHNYNGTDPTPVYRFLCDLQHQSGRTSLMFMWGGLLSTSHLPRVMYDNIILSRERWTMSRKQLPLIKGKVTLHSLHQWAKECHLPRLVSLVAGDNKLLVDTQCVSSVEAMLSELNGDDAFVLEEFIPSRGVVHDSRGHDCQNECIVPLIRVGHEK